MASQYSLVDNVSIVTVLNCCIWSKIKGLSFRELQYCVFEISLAGIIYSTMCESVQQN